MLICADERALRRQSVALQKKALFPKALTYCQRVRKMIARACAKSPCTGTIRYGEGDLEDFYMRVACNA